MPPNDRVTLGSDEILNRLTRLELATQSVGETLEMVGQDIAGATETATATQIPILSEIEANTGETATSTADANDVLSDILDRSDQALSALGLMVQALVGVPTAITALSTAVQNLLNGKGPPTPPPPPPNPPGPTGGPNPPGPSNTSNTYNTTGAFSPSLSFSPSLTLGGGTNTGAITKAIADGFAIVIARMSGLPVPKTGGEKAAEKEPKEKKEKGTLEKVLDQFSVKVLAVLGPVGILAATLSSATSGLGVFLSAVKVLAATLAPIVLPFFLVLSAALVALSDYIWERLSPVLEQFYTWIFKTAAGGLALFADALQHAWNYIKQFIGSMAEWRAAITRFVAMLGKGREDSVNWLSDKLAGAGEALGVVPEGTRDALKQMNAEANKQKQNGQTPPGESWGNQLRKLIPETDTGKDVKERFQKGLKDSAQEFAAQNGPKASFSSLVQTSRAAQLAAFNESPFQAKVLQKVDFLIGATNRAADNAAKETGVVVR